MAEFNHFDAGGNLTYSREAPASMQEPGQRQDRVSYYDGGGGLWAVDLRHGDNGIARSTPLYYTYEEYRLDALGRRVLVRARKSCQNHPLENEVCPMLSSVRRTVWAGDRELYEIQMPDEHGENDTAEAPTQPRVDGFDPNPFWGRVAYTYGGAIDQPLSIVRVGYKDYYNSTTGTQAWPEFAIIPHWNAHGQAQTGTFHDGTADFCRGGYPEWCVKLQWADGLFPYKPGPPVPEHWHGTLMGQKKDASGLMYRRNRYYDPATGRFTQEDPIGLAGGVNVYGFANGDPVTYSDPYGLCAKVNGREDPECRRVINHLRTVAAQARVPRGIQNRFLQAAQLYEDTDRRVERVRPNDPRLRATDGSFAAGRTRDGVYLISNSLGAGDLAAVAAHEAIVHEHENGMYHGDRWRETGRINTQIWFQLGSRYQQSAPFWRAKVGIVDEPDIWE